MEMLRRVVKWPQPSEAQYIGVFLGPNATLCAADVGSPRVDLHIIAILQGEVTETTGAESRIVGAPASWTQENVLWVPDIGSAGLKSLHACALPTR